MSDIKENVIEWITGDDWIACTFTQKKYINKVRKLSVKYPQFVPVFIENEDGSIFCHLPLKSLKLSIITPTKRTFGKVEKGEVEDDG